MLDSCKMLQKQSEAIHSFLWHFSKFNTEFYCISLSSRPDCIFEIPQLWQSGFSRVYSNCCCSFSFEVEIIKIGQASHKMYCNNIQESSTILDACTKNVWKIIEGSIYIYIYIYILIVVIDVSVSAWKFSINAVIGEGGMLLSTQTLKSLNSIGEIQPRMMCASFNGNTCTTLISCSTAIDETDVITFCNELSGLVRSIPKHNVLIIGRDLNA